MSLSCYNSSSPYSTPTLTLLPMNLFSIELSTATPDHVSPLLRTHSELPCPCTKSTSLNMAHRALGPGTLLRNLPHLMPNSQSLHSRHIYLFLIFSHMSSFVPPPNFYIYYFLCLDPFPTYTAPSSHSFEDIFLNPLVWVQSHLCLSLMT